MLARLRVIITAALLPMSLNAQAPVTSRQCTSNERALRAVAHDFWAAYNKRDAGALDRVLDDRLLYVSESGSLLSKAQVLESFRIPQGSIKVESAEEPENVGIAFDENVAVMSFTKTFRLIHQPTGATFSATARMTETFVCGGGDWKVIAFQETLVADLTRRVYEPAVEYFGDYVGKYRFGEDGRGGEITVTRRDNRLYESWGPDEPVEILPGKFDMFFTPGFPILERFVRDRRGRVVGIVYTLGDRVFEATRVE